MCRPGVRVEREREKEGESTDVAVMKRTEDTAVTEERKKWMGGGIGVANNQAILLESVQI